MLPATAQSHARRANRFDSTHGVALYTGHLYQAADWVAGQSQVMFHGNFRRVLHLLWSTTQSVGQRTTASVVQSIFAVIALDALFSILFSELGI